MDFLNGLFVGQNLDKSLKNKNFVVAHNFFKQGSPLMREFSAFWYLFLVFQNKSDLKRVAELIIYSQKTRNCGHFLSYLLGLRCKNIFNTFTRLSVLRISGGPWCQTNFLKTQIYTKCCTILKYIEI